VDNQNQEYAGFWIRVGASLIDTILLVIIIGPILTAIYGKSYWLDEAFVQGFWDFVISYVLPAIAVVIFWVYKSATPGKMATRLTIVDAQTGGKPSPRQFVIRYIGYYLAALPLLLGLIWVGFDRRKQGWHDKLAGTVVLKNSHPEPVKFEGQK
jgi:uncharacterized RDD family membrane protein YckC